MHPNICVIYDVTHSDGIVLRPKTTALLLTIVCPFSFAPSVLFAFSLSASGLCSQRHLRLLRQRAHLLQSMGENIIPRSEYSCKYNQWDEKMNTLGEGFRSDSCASYRKNVPTAREQNFGIVRHWDKYNL